MDSKAPNIKPGLMSLQTKFAISFAILAIISSGIVTAAIYLKVRSRIYEDIRYHLRDAVSIGALHVNGDAHALLIDPADEASDAYLTMKKTSRKSAMLVQNFFSCIPCAALMARFFL
jgi:hypothetical protein